MTTRLPCYNHYYSSMLMLLLLNASFIYSLSLLPMSHHHHHHHIASRKQGTIISTANRRDALSGIVFFFLSAGTATSKPAEALAKDLGSIDEINNAPIPTDFTVVPEKTLPFSQHYVENAVRLANNLKWCSLHVDAEANKQLKAEISAFNALYRRDLYTQYGALPGFQSLVTAYDATATHLVRYGYETQMDEKLANTICRNVLLAEKALAKTDLTKKMSEALTSGS